MERLAFERDAGADDRARIRSAHLVLAGLMLTLTLAAIAAAEVATRGGDAPARAAFDRLDEPPLGRPGRRY